MAGKKLKIQLVAGMALWGLLMSFPIGSAWAQLLDNESEESASSFPNYGTPNPEYKSVDEIRKQATEAYARQAEQEQEQKRQEEAREQERKRQEDARRKAAGGTYVDTHQDGSTETSVYSTNYSSKQTRDEKGNVISLNNQYGDGSSLNVHQVTREELNSNYGEDSIALSDLDKQMKELMGLHKYAGFRDYFNGNGGKKITFEMMDVSQKQVKLQEMKLAAEAGGDTATAQEIEQLIKAYEYNQMAWSAKQAKALADVLGDDKMGVSIMEYTDANGVKKTILLNDDLEATGGVWEGCMPIMIKLSEARKCIFCPLFITLANTTQTMTKGSYNALKDGFINVMLIAFALYVGFVTLRQVSSFTKQDGPKYVTELLTLSFKVLFAYLILTHIHELYSLVLTPMMKAGIEFGGAFLFHNPAGVDVQSCMGNPPLTEGQIADGFFHPSLFAQVDCFIRAVLQELAVPQALGGSLMCVSWHSAGISFLPDVSMMVSGFVIWLFAWLVSLAFAFYLIDAVIRLGIVGALVPFLVAAWPFKVTAKYTTKGWNMFMNSFFIFVFLGLVVSVNVELGGQALSAGADEAGSNLVLNYMNQDRISEVAEMFGFWSMSMLFLVLCSVFGFKLCSEAISLAQSMSEAQGGNIGAQLGSDTYGAAKGVGMKAAKLGGKAALVGGKAIAKKTGASQWASDKANKVSDVIGRFMGFKPKASGGSGSSGGGSATGGGGSATGAPSTASAPAVAPVSANNTSPIAKTERDYHKNGQLAAERIADAEGNRKWMTRYENGNKRTEGWLDADGTRHQRNYYDNGQLASETVTDANGNQLWENYNRDGSLKNEGSDFTQASLTKAAKAEARNSSKASTEAATNNAKQRLASSAEQAVRAAAGEQAAAQKVSQGGNGNSSRNGGGKGSKDSRQVNELKNKIRQLEQQLREARNDNNIAGSSKQEMERKAVELENEIQRLNSEISRLNAENAELGKDKK